MRKLVLLFAPATLALAALAACEDDSSTGGGNLSLDGGNGAYDAPNTSYDANLPDTVPDAQPDVFVPPQVNVSILGSNGQLKAGTLVVFHDDKGAVLETKESTATGKVVHAGSDAKMVSALVAVSNRRQIVTWTGVEVGDDLKLTVADGSFDETVGYYQVNIATTFDDAGGMFDYPVSGPCGSNTAYGTAAQLPLQQSCLRPQNAVLVASSFGTPGGYAFKKNLPPVTDGGTYQVSVDGWLPPTPVTLSVTNAPPQAPFSNSLYEIANGAAFENGAGTSENDIDWTYPTATKFADALQAMIETQGLSGQRKTLTKRVAPTATIAFDWSTLLPDLTDGAIDATNHQRPVISWAGTTAGTDGGAIQFSYGGTDDANYSWTLIVPPGATTVTAPAMPTEAASFIPVTESWMSEPTILFVEADVLADYKTFRNNQGLAFGLADQDLGSYSAPTALTNGTYRTTSYLNIPR
jgi:hypothetical protein